MSIAFSKKSWTEKEGFLQKRESKFFNEIVQAENKTKQMRDVGWKGGMV